jgi:hypothetical protein
MSNEGGKISWHGVLISIQPRIRLSRSFDQRSHTYLGYTLTVRGSIGTEVREFLLGVGQGTHAKHHFRAGDTVTGDALPVADPRLETVEFYKIGNLKIRVRKAEEETPPPPWRGVPPPLPVYRGRGHRRLAARTYQEKCASCIWGCQMRVEMIIDQWNPNKDEVFSLVAISPVLLAEVSYRPSYSRARQCQHRYSLKNSSSLQQLLKGEDAPRETSARILDYSSASVPQNSSPVAALLSEAAGPSAISVVACGLKSKRDRYERGPGLAHHAMRIIGASRCRCL